MNKRILNYIKLVCIIVFYFSFFVSNLSAIDYFRYKYIVQQNQSKIATTATSLYKCINSRINNFKDKSPTERIVLIYLNTLLNKILTDNEAILKTYKRSPNEFCIDIDTTPRKEGSSDFYNSGMGLILINLHDTYLSVQHGMDIYDSHVLASLSHEIAHSLLNHFTTELSRMEYIYDTSEFKDKYSFDEYTYEISSDPIISSKLEEDYEKWIDFYKTHPYHMEYRRQGEIDADNLGLELYINTGFQAIDFGKQYMDTIDYDDIMKYIPVSDFLIVITNPELFEEEERKSFERRINELMDSMKYNNPKAYNPSDIWRYWNSLVQIELYKKNNGVSLDSTVVDGLYFRIDLSKSKKLKKIKNLFSNTDNIHLSVTNPQSPLFYIIEQLIIDNLISYTLEFFPDDKDKLGQLKDDNTIVLRANDVFQVALMKKEPQFSNNLITRCIRMFLKTIKYIPYKPV